MLSGTLSGLLTTVGLPAEVLLHRSDDFAVDRAVIHPCRLTQRLEQVLRQQDLDTMSGRFVGLSSSWHVVRSSRLFDRLARSVSRQIGTSAHRHIGKGRERISPWGAIN